MYDDPHPHGDLTLDCTVHARGNRLEVYFKTCPEYQAEFPTECAAAHWRHSTPLFTLIHAGPRLLTHWGQINLGADGPKVDGVFFEPGPSPNRG